MMKCKGMKHNWKHLAQGDLKTIVLITRYPDALTWLNNCNNDGEETTEAFESMCCGVDISGGYCTRTPAHSGMHLHVCPSCIILQCGEDNSTE